MGLLGETAISECRGPFTKGVYDTRALIKQAEKQTVLFNITVVGIFFPGGPFTTVVKQIVY